MKLFYKFKYSETLSDKLLLFVRFFLCVSLICVRSQYAGALPKKELRSVFLKNSHFSTEKTYHETDFYQKFVQAPSAIDIETPTTICNKSDFESVVDKAAGVLREFNLKNKPNFHEKLKLLKDKRGWTDTIFEKEAVRFVKDEEIDKLDAQTLDLLSKITSMGDEGSALKMPDCKLLEALQKYMQELITVQTAKWAYLFQKIDREMVKE